MIKNDMGSYVGKFTFAPLQLKAFSDQVLVPNSVLTPDLKKISIANK